MNTGAGTSISLEIDERCAGDFFVLLQGGFSIASHIGCDVMEFLTGQCGIEKELISKIISAVFLDGKPVDDLESAQLHDGANLALSGPLPGLVGAVMKRGSAYSSFRRSISYKGEDAVARGEGMVTVKLFNTLTRELGPRFLARGVLIPPRTLADFLAKGRDAIAGGCRAISLDGSSVSYRHLVKRLLSMNGLVSLAVKPKTSLG